MMESDFISTKTIKQGNKQKRSHFLGRGRVEIAKSGNPDFLNKLLERNGLRDGAEVVIAKMGISEFIKQMFESKDRIGWVQEEIDR